MSRCLLSIVCLSAMLSASVASADPERHSDTDFQQTLSVVTDGEGRFIAFTPESPDRDDRIFFGDAKTLHRVPYMGWSRNGDTEFSYHLLDPRHHQKSFDFKDGRYTVTCDNAKRSFTLLDPEKTRDFLANAVLMEALEYRVPHFLGRDEFGNYYYVDRLLTWKRIEEEDGGVDYQSVRTRDFRLYKGHPGSLKKLQMRNVVSDSEGEIFSSRSGTLRLIVSNPGSKSGQEATWIQKKERVSLVELPLNRNRELIFVELGISSDQKFGMPCDL